jgi:hypothetical protein
MTTLKKRRGLSPAITTLIILGIAVIAGVAVFQNFQSQSSVASARGAITVENLALIKNPSGELWLSATIKNSGNKQIVSTAVNLQVDTDSGTAGIQPFLANPSPASLNPSQTASVFVRVVDSTGSPITSVNVGQSIPVEIRGTTPDGSVLTTPTSVMTSLA